MSLVKSTNGPFLDRMVNWQSFTARAPQKIRKGTGRRRILYSHSSIHFRIPTAVIYSPLCHVTHTELATFRPHWGRRRPLVPGSSAISHCIPSSRTTRPEADRRRLENFLQDLLPFSSSPFSAPCLLQRSDRTPLNGTEHSSRIRYVTKQRGL